MAENIKILIVDDEKKICQLIKDSLETISDNYFIKTAYSGMEAISLINTEPFDILVTDLRMPQMDGNELIKQTIEKAPDTQIIVITGHGDMDSAINAMRLGAVNYIRKPISIEVLDIAIQKAYEKTQLSIKLKNSEKQYRELVDNAKTAIIKIDTKGCILFFNEYAEKLLGYSLNEVLESNISLIYQGDIISHMNEKNEIDHESLNKTKSGKKIWILWNNKKLFDDNMNHIGCISLIMDLSGFDQLSIHWQLSWAKTTIVSLWMVLFFMLIREFDNYKPAIQLSDDLQHNTQKTVKWAFIRVSYLLWALTTIIMILFAWGVSFKRIVSLFNILNHPIPIGSMNICLPGFVYFFLILIFTHMIVKIWRNTILKNMLAHSGMATGIQETISTVTSYSFWVFGIIIALNAVGITTTSLTFAFGAFGIGLGFGLQNIFNNFISGLILLFERPIQVGDWVEINNIWGTVKKINVRSTVVQTADNASLIIPNSEFISSRLTNWSFKDLKIRRKINIGVAYGSDINKVKEILLEIAKSNSNVYRRPEPDVVFIDFGDSALLFQLRIWVHVDFSISTQSNIRFEIDRLFKENNINIPFPQQDVHIYSHKM